MIGVSCVELLAPAWTPETLRLSHRHAKPIYTASLIVAMSECTL